MRIVRNLLLVVAVACCSLPTIMKDTITAQATSWNDYSIHQGCTFDVDVVNDQGGFDHKGCYNDFASAKKAMEDLGQDGVVRNANSVSPTKIIAMMNGLVSNVPYRRFGGAGGDQTQTFYSNSDFTGSSTYTRQYQNAKYTGTVSYDGNGYGSVGLLINGFYGYVNMYDCDLIPIKYITNNLPITLGGGGENSYVIYPKMNTYTIVNNEMKFQSYWIWSDYDHGSTSAVGSTSATLPKADWMSNGTTYYSYDGYTFYTDQAMNNYVGTYYNYYQFLPLRTKSNLTASDLQNYLNQVGYGSSSVMSGNAQAFIDAQNTYGVNALMVYAMACHESAYGTSYYATTRANLFGWNAVDSNPDLASSYSGIYAAVEQHMAKNLNGYLDIDDGRHFGMAVGNKGNGFNVCYASDTYWGIKIASIAYAIDKSAGLKDLNSVQLGVVSTESNNVYFTHSPNGSKWYTIINDEGKSYGGYNPRAYLVPILGEQDGYYKTQTSDHLTNGSLTRASSSNYRAYDFDNNVAWISKNWLTVLNNGTPVQSSTEPETTPEPEVTPTPEPSVEPEETPEPSVDPEPTTTPETEEEIITDNKITKSVDSISISDDQETLTIEGRAFYLNKDASLDGSVKHTVLLVNDDTGETIELETETIKKETNIPAIHTYDAIGYRCTINVNDLPSGNYYFAIKLKNDNTEGQIRLTFTNYFNQSVKNDNNETVHIFSNSTVGYRLDLSVEKNSLDLNDVNRACNSMPKFGILHSSIEGSNLHLDGYTILGGVDMNEANSTSIDFYLVNEDGEVIEIPCSTISSTANFKTIYQSNYDLSKASYTLDYDLSSLNSGTYRLYVKVTSGEYSDIFEAYNYNGKSVTTDNYSLAKTNVRARYELTVK